MEKTDYYATLGVRRDAKAVGGQIAWNGTGRQDACGPSAGRMPALPGDYFFMN